MRGLKKIIEEDIKLEEKLLRKYRAELSRMPRGSLNCYKKGKQIYYKHSVYGKDRQGRPVRVDRHLKKGDGDLVFALQRKAHLKEAVQRMEQNLKRERELAERYQSYDCRSVQEALGEAYRLETMAGFLEQEGIELEVIPDGEQNYMAEYLTQRTSAGFYVRSKGEMLIAEGLLARGIVFQFEPKIYVNLPDGNVEILHPDFKIPLRDGRTLIWEHLGLLSDQGYAQRNWKKLHLYTIAGYTIGSDLILTADDAEGNTDMESITRILDWIETVAIIW